MNTAAIRNGISHDIRKYKKYCALNIVILCKIWVDYTRFGSTYSFSFHMRAPTKVISITHYRLVCALCQLRKKIYVGSFEGLEDVLN